MPTEDDDNSDEPMMEPPTDRERRAHFEVYSPGMPVVQELMAVPRSAYEHKVEERLSSLEDSRRFWRWIAGLGLPVMATAMLTLGIWAAETIASSSERVGETAAEIRDLVKQVDRLERQIDLLLKLSGLNPKPVSVVRAP